MFEIIKVTMIDMEKKQEVNSRKVIKELDRYKDRVSKKNIINAETKALKFREDKRISDFWNRIQIMFEIAKNPKVWGPSVALIVAAALIYLVSPLDVIPDVLPVVGLTDDIIAITFSLTKIATSAKEKILQDPTILNGLSEKLRDEAVKLFKLDKTSIDSVKEKLSAIPKKIEDVSFVLKYNFLLGASSAVQHFGTVVENESKKGKPNSIRARLNAFFLRKTETIINWKVEKEFNEKIQAKVDFAVEKKTTKVLLSAIFFSLALASYLLTQYGVVWVYVSSILMLVSYSFVLVAIVNIFRFSILFLVGGIKNKKKYPFFTFFDGAVSAVALEMFDIKEQYTKVVLDELKSKKHIKDLALRVLFKLFNGEVSRGIFHFILLCVVFTLLKMITTQLGFGVTPLRVVLGPILMLVEQFG